MAPTPPLKPLNHWQRFDARLTRFAWAPTAEGLIWGLLSLLIMVQGWLRGFNLVTFIATFLLAMWVLNALAAWWMGRRMKRLRFERRLQGLVHAGTPTAIALEVENTGSASIAAINLFDEGSAHRVQYSIPELPAGSAKVLYHRVVPVRRGHYQWSPLRITTAYPFGLFRRSLVRSTHHDESIVLPMLGKLDQLQFRRWLRSSQRQVNTLTKERARRCTAPADFYGIREYRAGDSPRWIHWRTTARVGEPMVREFEEPPQQHLLIILEAWLPESVDALMNRWRNARQENSKQLRALYRRLGQPSPEQHLSQERQLEKREQTVRAPLDRLEFAISLMATLCWTWTRKLGAGLTLGIIDGSEKNVVMESGPSLRTVMPMLERLAVVQGKPEFQLQSVIRRLSQRRIPKGHLLVVSPRASTTAGQLSHSLGRPVQLLDVSQPDVNRFFMSSARAFLT